MTPDLRISADGRDITAVVRDRLVSLSVKDGIGTDSDACELTLDDRDAVIAPPPTGAVLDIGLGWREQGLAPMGRFVVDARELSGPPRTLSVRATGPDLLAGLKASHTRSWDHVTLGDLVGAIAAANGLRAQVDGSLRGLLLPHIDQIDESDLSVLRRLARQLDAVVRPANGALVVISRQELARGMAPVATVRRTDTSEYRLLEGDRDAYGAVKAQWRSAPTATPMAVRVGAGDGPVHSLSGIYPDEASARNAAEAKLRALQRGTSTASIALSAGLPVLAAEAPLALADFGAPLDGRWVAIRTEHAFTDAAGYVTKATLERPSEPWGRVSSTPG